MRLLHSRELRFAEFFDDQIPLYAILSHRWGGSEISFQTLNSIIELSTTEPEKLSHPRLSGSGFDKIRNFRSLVAQTWDWVWIDTCCINKESSAELSEAINSMYSWYRNAETCNIYLSDVDWEGRSDTDMTDLLHFTSSLWFTRGWTLQELLAPRQAHFYDKNWMYIGPRLHWKLNAAISKATSIEQDIIGTMFVEREKKINGVCVAKKMSWLSTRKTTRIEDMAYCMLGLFGVNMPLLYGEGRKAFLRLQLELIRKEDDESIFAWNMEGGPYNRHHYVRSPGLLAPWPTNFSTSRNLFIYQGSKRLEERPPYAMTNQGLLIQDAKIPPGSKEKAPEYLILPLNCYELTSDGRSEPVVLRLEKDNISHYKYWGRHQDYGFVLPWMEKRSAKRFITPIYILQGGM